ncbi:metallophosphoesterase family protein [Paenibacillus cremeus]|uniref:Serine/threonine protein phosphatase n=1 Tax=Paenibacillus cremeus TaxID=2163881 RepID=A0A559K516_9BACL|nr:metallophosphoesterase family protein [Paenibacillus cremeus]TVY07238.1 serine/threonine protein phosphatase [Paenibacillus cremeus]
MRGSQRKTFVISDIHGCLVELEQLLTAIPFRKGKDQLILLGDYVDRGPNSKEVLERIIQLTETCHAVALRGNHDQMFLEFLEGEDPYSFIYNGGIHTLLSYCGPHWFDELDFFIGLEKAREYITTHFPTHVAFLQSLPLYYEAADHLFVHAGINPDYADWKNQPIDDFLWIREDFIDHPTGLEQPVVFGHTTTLDMEDAQGTVWFGGDKIGIDGGCVYGGQLNCLEIGPRGYRAYSVRSV